MKKSFLLIFTSILIFEGTIYGQGGNLGNNSLPGGFLGFNGIGLPQVLQIRNDFNERIMMYTNATLRQRINAFNTGNNINGHTFDRSGFMAIGTDNNGLMTVPARGAFSMLHLNGGFGGFQTAGHHDWMNTGITFTDNGDLAYIGVRRMVDDNNNPINNTNEFVVLWSNNPNAAAGPDDMCFRFSNNQGRAGNDIDPNLTLNSDGDGLHIARFTGLGNMGLGPTFGINNALYVAPQSLMHMSRDNNKATWLQITNQNGTGQTATDGLRLGFRNTNVSPNGEGYLRWQENTAFLIQTDWNNASGGINNGERMRITTINSPGVPNPAAPFINNTTRVAISHQGNQPVTAPRSLLHLGYNTGLFSVPQGSTDGWRDWMDIGTFTSNGTDNMYVGLKREAGAVPANDRHDAIINWGDNDGTSPLPNGPDNLRFIFTSTTTGTGNPPANSNNGLEVARFDPQLASTIAAPNYGMMGIGDFSPAGPNALPALAVDAKLDIDGDLRIRQVTEDTNSIRVLVIDTSDLNRVHYRDITDLTGFGSLCGSTTPLQLIGNSEVQLNNFDFHFSGNGADKTQNNVGIGTQCNFPLAAKLMVNQNTTNEASTGVYVRNGDNSDAIDGSPISLFAITTGNDLQTGCNTVAGWFEARPSSGQQNIALCVPQNGGVVNIGFATPDLTTPPTEPNVCANQLGAGGSIFSINGNGFATGMFMGASDIVFKKNIAPITDALAKVKKLNGVYYDYDNTNYPSINFSTERQVGLIAQNVDTVLTEVTVFDSSLQAYTMDYSRINALLIEAIKEQDDKVDSLEQLTETQDSINNDLENRLAVLEQCINEANLCSSTSRTTNTINENTGQSIELSNLNAIILDQNLPNPFAENTTITYSIPDDIMEAQLLFYDMNGRIIKQVDITDRGESKLTVYGNNLEKGIYTYSLIADGKLIATKKMLKQ